MPSSLYVSPWPRVVAAKPPNDVSEGGARVRCPNLTEDERRQMMSEIRFARLQLRQDQKTDRLYCRVVWISPRMDENGKVIDDLGLSFEVRHPSDEAAVLSILERARATATGATPRGSSPTGSGAAEG